MEAVAPDEKKTDSAFKAGDAQYGTSTIHLPENSGDTGMQAIVIELKGTPAE